MAFQIAIFATGTQGQPLTWQNGADLSFKPFSKPNHRKTTHAPNARYNAQIRSIGRIFCLPCLFGCGECPKPCHARIFWQVNRPHLGADFHKLIGLIWIGQIDILGVILYHEITPWLWLRTKHFQSITVFYFLSIENRLYQRLTH